MSKQHDRGQRKCAERDMSRGLVTDASVVQKIILDSEAVKRPKYGAYELHGAERPTD